MADNNYKKFVSPYPQSKTIKGIRWLGERIRYPGSLGDTWSCTWADDGEIYSTADDGTGINDSNNSNLALFKIEGKPPEHKISLVNPMSQYGTGGEYDRADSWKANGLICIDGVLYMGVSQHSSAIDYPDGVQRTYDGSIIKSTDHGKTWSCKRINPMFPGPRFSTPFFVQYGKNYEGAIDEFVYIVSGTSWNNGNALTMLRVARNFISNLNASNYEVFTGLDQKGEPKWAPYDPAKRLEMGSIFKCRNYTSMTGIHYFPALKRFLLPEWAYADLDGPDPWFRTVFHLYEAPKPWGPWSLAHVDEDFGNGAWYNPSLPSKWFEEDGRKLWMVCGGDWGVRRLPASKESEYAFFARQFELIV